MFHSHLTGCGRRFAHGKFGFHGRHAGRGLRHLLRGGGRMHGRFFDHGDLRYVILRLLADKPRHGYEVIKAIEEMLAGAYSPSPGVVYPTLTLLEELGYAQPSDAGDGKRLYTITASGTEFLAANKPTVDAIFSRMERLGEGRGEANVAPVLRAMENLRAALRLRMSREPLTADQIQAIAASLDAAAGAVERS